MKKKKKKGYVRVSSVDQNPGTQIEQLLKHGLAEDEIFVEKKSGAALDRELNKIIENMEAGDTLYVTRLDRLGRKTNQLSNLVEHFKETGKNLVVLNPKLVVGIEPGEEGKEPDAYAKVFNDAFISLLSVFAQLERDLTKEKQRSGIALAKKQGKHMGRPSTLTDNNKKLKQAFDMYDEGKYPVKEILARTGIAKSSFYKALAIKEKRG